MLKIKVKEGTLELDDKQLVIKHTAGFFENVFSRLVNLWKRKEDSIYLNEISLVVYERGMEKTMCPHILVYYGNKSRLIEFCENGKEELQRVLDFFEEKGIELGVAVEA
jgi:hypothetical protein